ncbi:hypothetical protein [Nonomuraea insulae]|uniref:Uncharacterized protein n=1 Tax=Nonomuraea insulae TaxID=1616787 RepID=A0ABW1DE32_9ACTN
MRLDQGPFVIGEVSTRQSDVLPGHDTHAERRFGRHCLGLSLATLHRWLRTREIRKRGVTGHKDGSGRWVIILIDDAPGARTPGSDIEAQIRAACDLLARRSGDA